MKTKLYLDLEGTIITSFDDARLVNVIKISDFLDANPDIDRDDVRVFSFAIYNDKDKDKFIRFIKPMLERALNITITEWPSILDMALKSQKLTGNRWLDSDSMGGMNISEYIAIVGKVNAFDDWVLFDRNPGRFMLIDDIVPMKTVLYGELSMQLDYVPMR